MDVYKDEKGGVVLNRHEQEVTDLFLQLVAEEYLDIPDAARYALSALPNPDPLFVRWLSRGEIVPPVTLPPH